MQTMSIIYECFRVQKMFVFALFSLISGTF